VFGQHWQDESWHEVLRLIAGLIDAKFVGEIIDYLLAQTVDRSAFLDIFGHQKKEGLSNLLLAAHCFAEVRNKAAIAATSAHLLETLQREVEQESPYKLDSESATALITLIATLWQEHPGTLSWLKICLQFGSSSYIPVWAVRAIAQGWKDDPETLSWLKSRAQSDDYLTVRSAAVQALARGWKDDFDTLAILKSRAQTDKNGDVRCVAVQELARGWKDDPDTLPWLKSRAQTDDDEDVRCAAVQALARGWKNDPETLSWLKSRTQSDDNGKVRTVAVQELARGWKDDPTMFEFLSDRALHDPFERNYWKPDPRQTNPRQAALEALVNHYPAHPQTRALFSDRAQNDPDKIVQKFATQKLAKLNQQNEHPL